MPKSTISTLILRVSTFAAAIAVAIIAPSCGGGGDGDQFGAPTVRPKTLYEVQLALDSFISLSFYPTNDNPGAIFEGDVETGAFEFDSLVEVGGIEGDNYPNINGLFSDVFYPIEVIEGTYQYRAINSTQAELTLIGIGQPPAFPIELSEPPINNGSLMGLFCQDSDGNVTNTIVLNLSFDADSGFATLADAQVYQPESTRLNEFDNVRIPVSAFQLFSGDQVPENYLGETDPDGYGNIVAPSLDDLLITCTNGIPDATKNFTLNFNASATGLFPGINGEDPEEIGEVIVSVDNGAGVLVAVSAAADYTWRRIPGGNTGELVLSEIPDDIFAFDAELNGSYIFDFEALDKGPYNGVDADRSGSFLTISAP